MSVDWDATGSMIQGLGTLAGVAAVVWGAWHAANTWREQKRAERRLEMAERILTATHKAKSALGYVRGPMMWAEELEKAEKRLKEEDGWERLDKRRRDNFKTTQVIYDRLATVKDDRAALVDCIPLARALFSKELEEALHTLLRQFWLVQVDADAYGQRGEADEDKEFAQKVRRGIFDITPPEGQVNEVTEAINASVATIERTCEPALRLET